MPRLTLVRPHPHPRRRFAAPSPRTVAERGAQECAVAATSHLDRVPVTPDDYWADLRRGRRRVYGGLLAFIDRARVLGTPFAVVQFAVAVVYAYACDVYGVDPTSPVPPVRRTLDAAPPLPLHRAA